MSQITGEAYQRRLERLAAHPAMAKDNINLPKGACAGLARTLIGLGIAGLLVTLAGAFVYNAKHAVASYAVGVFSVTAISLGALFWTMVFHQTNAGWHATVRRQIENIMMNLPLCVGLIAVMLIVELASGGLLFSWMRPEYADNHLLHAKKAWLNEPFLVVRFFIYAGVWTFLATKLFRYSLEQDRTGDRFLNNRARFTSAWGLLAFALTTGFFAFDFIMAMDFRFFSTMWGVYYFASGPFSCMAVLLLVTGMLRLRGRLTGAVTNEHVHDMGKLLFGMNVFWSYIAFGQYFLIWYGNIPEETAWIVYRKQGGWENLAAFLAIGHFFIPFLILLQRPVKRHPALAAAVGVWLLFMLVMDMVWLVRPMVYTPASGLESPGPAAMWIDVAAVAGVCCLWAGVLVRRIASGPLIPLKDPRLTEALEHCNYV